MLNVHDESLPARSAISISGSSEVSQGEYLRIQEGTGGNPTDMCLQQVPAGKKWTVRYNIYITETNA